MESLTRHRSADYFTAVDADADAAAAEQEEAARRRAMRRLGESFIHADSYGLVLVFLIGTYALAVSVTGVWPSLLVIVAQLVTVWFVFRTARVRQAGRLVGVVIGAAAALVALGQLVFGATDPRPSPVVAFASALLYLLAVFVIVRHIATRPRVDIQSALGAVAAYMCLGMFFAFSYRGIGLWQTSPFFGSSGRGTGADCLFFSMTTLTTTGYGDLVPARNPGQSLAVMEMVTGQLFLIAAVGKVLSALPSRARRADDSGD